MGQEVVGPHVIGIVRDGLPGEVGRGRVVFLLERLLRLASQPERGIVPETLRARDSTEKHGGEGGKNPKAAARAPAGSARSSHRSHLSSKRTGKVTHTATGVSPRRAGSKRHWRTASTAALSRSGWPADWSTTTWPT